MVAPLVAAAGRTAVRKAVQHKASNQAAKATAGQVAASGVRKAERVTRLYRAANDNQPTEEKEKRKVPSNALLVKKAKVNRPFRHHRDEDGSRNRQQIPFSGGISPDQQVAQQSIESAATALLRKPMWSMVWPVIYISSPLQLLFGIIVWVAYGFWTSLSDWTWGLSDLVIDNDLIFGSVWIITMVLGIVSLGAVTLLFVSIGRMNVFSRPVTFWSFIILFALACFPFTGFLPSAAVFSLIVFWTFR